MLKRLFDAADVDGDGALNFAEMRRFLHAADALSDFDSVCSCEAEYKLSLCAHKLPTDLVGNLTFPGA
jgi:hypothetical protein